MNVNELFERLSILNKEKRVIISFNDENESKVEFHHIGFGDESVYPASDFHKQFDQFNRLLIGDTISSNGGCKHDIHGECESTTGQLDKAKSYKLKDFIKRLNYIVEKYGYRSDDEVHLDYDDGVSGNWYSSSIKDILETDKYIVLYGNRR